MNKRFLFILVPIISFILGLLICIFPSIFVSNKISHEIPVESGKTYSENFYITKPITMILKCKIKGKAYYAEDIIDMRGYNSVSHGLCFNTKINWSFSENGVAFLSRTKTVESHRQYSGTGDKIRTTNLTHRLDYIDIKKPQEVNIKLDICSDKYDSKLVGTLYIYENNLGIDVQAIGIILLLFGIISISILFQLFIIIQIIIFIKKLLTNRRVK